MGKKTKVGKTRKDRFYFLAKESAKVLVDLCAAPGGWLQVASKEMPVSSQIIGVDLVPIPPIPKVKTFVCDITTEKCKQAFALATDILRKGGWFITKVFRSRDYEPLKWGLSQFFRSVRAVKPEASRMESAEIFLVGQFYLAPDRIDSRFLDAKHVFGEIEQPQDRAALISGLLKDYKRKKKAEGYADGDNLYHELMVSKFLKSNDPLEALAKSHKVIFDMPDVENLELTTDIIKHDLQDIQVLAKSDIRNEPTPTDTVPTEEKELEKDSEAEDLEIEEEVQRLIRLEEKEKKKRSKRVRKEKIKLAQRLVLKMEHAGDQIEQEDSELFSLATLHDLVGLEEAKKLIGDTSLTGVDALIREQEAAARKKLREKLAEVRRSAIEGRARVVFDRRGDASEPADYEDDTTGTKVERDDLYLSSGAEESDIEADFVRSRKQLHQPTNVDIDQSGDDSSNESSDEDEAEDSSEDEEIDYSDYSEDDAESDTAAPVAPVAPAPPPPAKQTKKNPINEVQSKPTITSKLTTFKDTNDSGPSQAKRSGLPCIEDLGLKRRRVNPLLVDLDDAPEEVKEEVKIRSWLESAEMKKILEPLDDDSSNESSDSEDEKSKRKQAKKEKKSKRAANRRGIVQDEHTASGTLGATAQSSTKSSSSNTETGGTPQEEENTDKETTTGSAARLRRLKRPLTPEEQALAQRLIRSAKSRRDLIESNYHRLQFFEEPSALPDWFVDDESKHMRRPLPLETKLIRPDRPTAGRTIAKVEEAKARKKARMGKKLKKIRSRVNNISDDVPETERWRQIKQTYKKAGLIGKKQPPLHVIVNQKAGARNAGSRIPRGAKVKIVDKRMKADARGEQRASGGKGGRRGGRSSRGGSSSRGGRGGRSGGRPGGRPVKLMSKKPRRGGSGGSSRGGRR